LEISEKREFPIELSFNAGKIKVTKPTESAKKINMEVLL